MPIERITADDLRDMEHQEGLVLQGCGGEAQEWLDGINDLLTQDGILQNGSRFETVKVFQHDGLTNLLFPFENIQVDMGKLAMWRLQTHGAFGGTWLSDYVPNRLGGFRSARQETPRPLCYEEALGIISEYVETELSPPRENRTKKKEKHEHER